MKVLLINCPVRLDANPNCIPYGLATIASVLLAEGFSVDIFDINALRPSRDTIIDTLKRKTWDVAGVSGLITTFEFQKWLTRELRTINPKAPVISGGGLATCLGEMVFDQLDIDIATVGEGEQTMLEICQALDAGHGMDDIPGTVFRQNGHIIRNRSRNNISNLDEIPFPAWDLLPMEIYLKNPIWGNIAANSSGFRDDLSVIRSMNIISSRGCPFSCNYCYHLFGRSNYRFRSPQNIIEEIKALIGRYRVDFIGFVDDNMMASDAFLLEFCDIIEKEGIAITWGCHGRVTSARPEILQKMAQAGCVWIGYGIESGSQKMLNAMNKRATVEQARRSIINTRKAGIYANTTFIFGYPGETRETIQETINFKKELGITCGSFYATPYPGTPLYQQVVSKIEDKEDFILSLGNATEFTINLTSFDDKTLFKLKEDMDNNIDVL